MRDGKKILGSAVIVGAIGFMLYIAHLQNQIATLTEEIVNLEESEDELKYEREVLAERINDLEALSEENVAILENVQNLADDVEGGTYEDLEYGLEEIKSAASGYQLP